MYNFGFVGKQKKKTTQTHAQSVLFPITLVTFGYFLAIHCLRKKTIIFFTLPLTYECRGTKYFVKHKVCLFHINIFLTIKRYNQIQPRYTSFIYRTYLTNARRNDAPEDSQKSIIVCLLTGCRRKQKLSNLIYEAESTSNIIDKMFAKHLSRNDFIKFILMLRNFLHTHKSLRFLLFYFV